MGIYESRVDQLRRDLVRLREKSGRASRTVADERRKAADSRRQAARSRMPDHYIRQADAAEKRANKAEHERASIDANIARTERKLAEALTALDKERTRADAQRVRALEQRLQNLSLAEDPLSATGAAPLTQRSITGWNFFVSHASPDKDELVRPLTTALRDRGARVWFDEFELTVGDSLRAKIDEGLAKSRFGIVVLTPSYLGGRQWTENELNGLFAANRRILPIWHRVSRDEVAAYSPMLADRFALSTSLLPLAEIVDELMGLVEEVDQD